LKTLELRFGVPALTARDAAAPDFGSVLTATTPRTDDPMTGVTAPVSTSPNPAAGKPSHLQQIHADLVADLPVPGTTSSRQALPELRTADEYRRYITARTAAWKASRSH
jgi:phospholipase C